MTEKTVEPAGEVVAAPNPFAPPAVPPVPLLLPLAAGESTAGEAATGDPGAPVEPWPPTPPTPPRRVLRAVARWTVAVLVLGGLGAGTAVGIASMERTDVPGLATEDDGRWDYPQLSLPALPAGAPRPFADANEAEVHHADLRRLLLPAPAGASPDKELDGGWVTGARYATEYGKSERAELTQRLDDSALRHIAARGWTMPDGTSSRVYLLRFNSVAYATAFQDELFGLESFPTPLVGAAEPASDDDWPGTGGPEYTTTRVYTEAKPYGAEQVRHAYVLAGDTVALIVQSRKGAAGTETVPFHQTVVLQNQLLG
ncbi:hypothetical protein OG524_20090 [Streptomyces sp. NBC_01520]|uniref:hypothetical protein n=1 Tax=Streptomyces sp. NBC_01520 TaxID=2903892 RepID=UPI00386BAADE